MNYKTTTYKRVGTVGAVYLASNLLGCATIGSVSELERQVSQLQARVAPIQKGVEDVGARVERIEKKPNAEGPIMIKRGQGLDELYGWLRGRIIPQYNDKKSREDAEQNSDAITLIPTGISGIYYAVKMRDADGDGKPSKGDRTYPDGKRIQFVIDANELPEHLKYMLLGVRSAKQ